MPSTSTMLSYVLHNSAVIKDDFSAIELMEMVLYKSIISISSRSTITLTRIVITEDE